MRYGIVDRGETTWGMRWRVQREDGQIVADTSHESEARLIRGMHTMIAALEYLQDSAEFDNLSPESQDKIIQAIRDARKA